MKKNKKKKNYPAKYLSFSLLLALMGIFLMPKTAYLTTISQDSIKSLINRERTLKGLLPLAENKLLNRAAYEKGRAIFDSQTFKHEIENKKFSYWIKKTGYGYYYAGENLAIDFLTAEGAVKAWMGSASHKENILNEIFSETGIAVLDGRFNGKNTILVVQIFGSPAAEKPPIAAAWAENPDSVKTYPLSASSGSFAPAGKEYSLAHTLALPAENINPSYYGYLPPSPFRLSAYSPVLEIAKYPGKWLFFILISFLFILIFYLSGAHIRSFEIKTISKKTKRSKPAPI